MTPESRRTFRVVRCLDPACAHVFCAPIPADIAARYVDVVDTEYVRHSRARRLSAQAVLAVIGRHVAAGTLLDVGCSTGDFLVTAREIGYAVEGLELSHWASALARDRGLVVHGETLEAFARARPGGYDVVTLWGVLEHLAAPDDAVRDLRRLLRPGGVLALWTPDIGAVTRRVLGRLWWNWNAQHVQYFTLTSLTRLLGAHGFACQEVARYPFAIDHERAAYSLGRYGPGRVIARLLTPVFRVKPVWFLRLPGELFVVARRGA